MLSRRDFLRGGAAAGMLSAAPVGVVGASTSRQARTRFEAVCDTRCVEGEQFLSALGGAPYRTHGVTTDPGEVLAVLPEVLKARRALVGLTSDATLVLVQHLAEREGYRLGFYSEHRHDGDALTHTLHGETALVDPVTAALPAAAAQWPALLGRHAGELAHSRALRARRTVRVPGERPADSPGHLAAWVLSPA